MTAMTSLTEASALRRRARAAFLKRLTWSNHRDACSYCADILEDPPEIAADMLTHELLESCFGVGPDLSDAWQTAIGLFAAVKVADLSDKHRFGLIALLRFVAPYARHPDQLSQRGEQAA